MNENEFCKNTERHNRTINTKNFISKSWINKLFPKNIWPNISNQLIRRILQRLIGCNQSAPWCICMKWNHSCFQEIHFFSCWRICLILVDDLLSSKFIFNIIYLQNTKNKKSTTVAFPIWVFIQFCVDFSRNITTLTGLVIKLWMLISELWPDLTHHSLRIFTIRKSQQYSNRKDEYVTKLMSYNGIIRIERQ